MKVAYIATDSQKKAVLGVMDRQFFPIRELIQRGRLLGSGLESFFGILFRNKKKKVTVQRNASRRMRERAPTSMRLEIETIPGEGFSFVRAHLAQRSERMQV